MLVNGVKLFGRDRSEEDRVEWHVVTGEYPPQTGGVSDYTQQIARELANGGDRVHVWAPASDLEVFQEETALVHHLPPGFGMRWLREFDRQLKSYSSPRNILIQYVPHMYGWKSMNLAFCWWIFKQRKQNVCVMFHEVAFPFRSGQRFRHGLLAIVHRMMAWVILRSVRHSFTSTDPYLDLLQTLGNDETPINIPLESYRSDGISTPKEAAPNARFTVGVFSSFGAQLNEFLEPAIGCILGNPKMEVLLLGPGEPLRDSLATQYPEAADRIGTTGRLHVTQIAEHMRRCDALLQIYPEGASAARGTLIGAIASGLPVVTSRGPITDKFLLDSEAMLFSDGSPRSTRDAVELLSENPALARELGARAQRLYREAFQPSVIVSQIRNAMLVSTQKELVNEEAVLHG
jgi:glycosyltransferase involved in cell wall biosynthesis